MRPEEGDQPRAAVARDGGIIGSLMPLGQAGDLGLALYRPERAANFAEAERRILRGLLPHLRRAFQLGHRLDLAGLRDAAAALDAMPMGAVVVDATRRVLHANRAAEALARGGGVVLRQEGGGLRLGAGQDARGAARLADLVRQVALAGGAGGAGGALRLHRAGGEGAVAALVMPLPRLLRPAAAGGGGPHGRALVLLRDPDAPAMPGPGVLRDLFGLTPAEAAVALAVAGGGTAEAVAGARGVSVNTVRVQIRAAIEKTGAASARDMARLLASLPGA